MAKKRILNKWVEIHHSMYFLVVSLYAITQILVDMVFLHLFKMLFYYMLYVAFTGTIFTVKCLFKYFSQSSICCARILFNLSNTKRRKGKRKKSQINLFVLILTDMVERYHNNKKKKENCTYTHLHTQIQERVRS